MFQFHEQSMVKCECPSGDLTNCSWVGERNELVAHLRGCHQDRYKILDSTLDFRIRIKQIDDFQCLEYRGEIFIYRQIIKHDKKEIHVFVHMVAMDHKARKHFVHFVIKHNESVYTMIGICRSWMQDWNYGSEKDCLTVQLGRIRDYLEDDKLECELEIKQFNINPPTYQVTVK